MKKKIILGTIVSLILISGIFLIEQKNYATTNRTSGLSIITDLAKNLIETTPKITVNKDLIKPVNDTLIFFNGNQVTNLEIYNYNGSIYLPLRKIGNLIGKVSWYAEERITQVMLDNIQLEFLNDTNTVVIKKGEEITQAKITNNFNGQSVDLPTLNINGSVYLPVRFIAENFNINIDYTPNHIQTSKKTIEMNTGEKVELNIETEGESTSNTNNKEFVSSINQLDVYDFSEGLAKVYNKETEKYGYIDKTGKLVIPYQFDETTGFSEGLARVWNEKTGKYGYIDKTGKLVIPYKFDIAGDFSEGLATVYNKEIGKSGYIDKTGKLVIPYEFYFTGYFKENLASVKDEETGKCGYIDKTGKLVIPYKFDDVHYFKEGLAVVYNEKTRKYGYIDKTGKLVIPCEFVFADDFSEGLAKVVDEKTGKYGYIDKTGKLVIPYQFDETTGFSEGLARVWNEKTGKYGYIDKTGKLVIPYKFYFADNFSESLARVKEYEKMEEWIYIDKSGKMAIPYKLDYAGNFSEGLAYVELETEDKGYINKTGELVIPYEFQGNKNLEFLINVKE